MDELKKCLDLNSQAIECMTEGRFIEGSLLLRYALEKLEFYLASQPYLTWCPRHHADNMQASSSCLHSQNQVTGMDSTVGRCSLEPIESGDCTYTSVSIESEWTNDVLNDISNDNILSFYPRMFYLTYKGHIDSMELLKVTMIVMFNEALSRHVLALTSISKCKANPFGALTNVLNSYQKIVLLARSCFQYNDFREMLCVLVATTNNYGHIASQLYLFNETRDSISNIIHFLAISDENSFHHDDVRLFFESVCIFLEGRNLRNAPAA